MADSRLRHVMGQGHRLDVLCRIEREPLTVAQLGKGLGQPVSLVAYHLDVLQRAGLATRAGKVDGRTLYFASLANQPAWVAEAVDRHRQQHSSGPGTP